MRVGSYVDIDIFFKQIRLKDYSKKKFRCAFLSFFAKLSISTRAYKIFSVMETAPKTSDWILYRPTVILHTVMNSIQYKHSLHLLVKISHFIISYNLNLDIAVIFYILPDINQLRKLMNTLIACITKGLRLRWLSNLDSLNPK